MANPYSIIRTYGDYVTPYNLDLIQKGLEYKQQKYDYNASLIDAQVQELTGMQLAKPEDMQYLTERASALINDINQYGAADLSSGAVTRGIQNHLSQILDSNVITAYRGTQNMYKYMESVDWYKKNKPDEYSVLNDAWSRRPLDAWLYDGQVGTSFAGAEYAPYVDVQERSSKFIKELYKDSEATVDIIVEDKDGNPTGRIIRKKVKGLTEPEIQALAYNSLDARARNQMEINAWGTQRSVEQMVAGTLGTDDINDPSVQRGTLVYFQNEYDRYITEKDKEIKEQIVSADKRGDKDAVRILTQRREQFKTESNDLRNSTYAMSNFLEQARTQEFLNTMYRQRDIEFTFKKDDAYFAMVKLQQDLAEAAAEVAAIQNAPSGFNPTEVIGTKGEKQTDLKARNKAISEDGAAITTARNTLSKALLESEFSDRRNTLERQAEDVAYTKGLGYEDALAEVLMEEIGETSITSENLVSFHAAQTRVREFADANLKSDRETAQNQKKAVMADGVSRIQNAPNNPKSSNAMNNLHAKYARYYGKQVGELTDEEVYNAMLLDAANSSIGGVIGSRDDGVVARAANWAGRKVVGSNPRDLAALLNEQYGTPDNKYVFRVENGVVVGATKAADDLLMDASRKGLRDNPQLPFMKEDVEDISFIKDIFLDNKFREDADMKYFPEENEIGIGSLIAEPNYDTKNGRVTLSVDQKVFGDVAQRIVGTSSQVKAQALSDGIWKKIGKTSGALNYDQNTTITITPLKDSNVEISYSSGVRVIAPAELVSREIANHPLSDGKTLNFDYVDEKKVTVNVDRNRAVPLYGINIKHSEAMSASNPEYYENTMDTLAAQNGNRQVTVRMAAKSPNSLIDSVVYLSGNNNPEVKEKLGEIFTVENIEKMQDLEFYIMAPAGSSVISMGIKTKNTNVVDNIGEPMNHRMENSITARRELDNIYDGVLKHSNVGLLYYFNSLCSDANAVIRLDNFLDALDNYNP